MSWISNPWTQYVPWFAVSLHMLGYCKKAKWYTQRYSQHAILWMEEFLHQLVYGLSMFIPLQSHSLQCFIVTKLLPTGAGFLPSTFIHHRIAQWTAAPGFSQEARKWRGSGIVAPVFCDDVLVEGLGSLTWLFCFRSLVFAICNA